MRHRRIGAWDGECADVYAGRTGHGGGLCESRPGQHGTADAPLTVGKRASGGPGLKNGTVSQLFGKTIVLPVYDPNRR